MPGDLKQALAHDVRSEDEIIPVPKNQCLLVFLDLVADYRAPRVPENETRSDPGIGRVEIELLRQHAVIPSLRLLQLMQVRLEIFLLPERRGVDALKHLPMLIATPVRAGGVQQLEVLEIRRIGDVRPLAQIHELPVGVGRDDLAFREFAEPLELERVVREALPRLRLRHLFADERILLRDHLLHFRVELLEVFRGERLRDLKIVVEPVLDGGAEADLSVWPEPANCCGQDVSARMPEHSERFGVLLGKDPELPALPERSVQIDDFAVHLYRDRVPEQPWSYGCDDVARQGAFGSFAGGAVGEPQRQHFLGMISSTADGLYFAPR